MSVSEIEKRYAEVAEQVKGMLEEGEERRRRWEGEVEGLRMARDMERRVFGRFVK